MLAALSATSVAAQSSLTAGATAGAVKLTDQRSEQALTGVVQYQARPWLSLSAMPSLVHVSDVVSGRSVASSGAGDLPVSAAAFHGFASPGSAVIAAALTLVLPVGNAACGLGSGNTSLGLDVGAGVSPSRRLHLSADASRSLSGLSAQSALSAPHATAVRADAGYDISSRWRASASLGADVGAVDSTQGLSRVLGAGAGYRLSAPVTLTLDGSIGLAAASPKWALSIGIGSAFAGTSPVSLSSPLRRLKTTFAGGVNRGSGGGKIGCR
ncbi:MAG: hypothetical protein DMD69_02535 [Gemmatimonadetes bacterium]|nr:MAG: hypothetical protein DMD69_02535 [Gemmatimonadota bacterium]